MAIDAKLVAELRKRTGLPMMKCKQALVDAGGDIETAAVNLRKQGVKAQEKVAHRELKEGTVFHKVLPEGACAVSVLCQTDFVARSDDIVKFGTELAEELWKNAPADTGTGESLAAFALPSGGTVADALEQFALKIRENIQVGSYVRFMADNSHIGTYYHHNKKIATFTELAGEGARDVEGVAQLGSDLCMHLAFHSDVKVLSQDDLDPAWLEKEREIFAAQVQDQPEERREAIAKGKLAKRMKEVVFLNQPFIKDEKKSVQQAVSDVAKVVGKPLEIRRFARVAAGA